MGFLSYHSYSVFELSIELTDTDCAKRFHCGGRHNEVVNSIYLTLLLLRWSVSHPSQTKLDMNAGSWVDKLGLGRVNTSQHNSRVALLAEVD